jgi:hypothetical protein
MRNLTQYLEQLVDQHPIWQQLAPATAPTGWPTSSTSRGWQDSHLHTKGWQLDR